MGQLPWSLFCGDKRLPKKEESSVKRITTSFNLRIPVLFLPTEGSLVQSHFLKPMNGSSFMGFHLLIGVVIIDDMLPGKGMSQAIITGS